MAFFTDQIRGLQAELKAPRKATQVELAKFFGVHQSTVNGWLKGREPRKHEDRVKALELIAEFDEGRGIPRNQTSTTNETDEGDIPVDGYVSAGDGRFESFNSGRFIRAKAPPGTRALEIRGESLGIALEGWYALYRDQFEPYTADMLGTLCIVDTEDGRRLVKRLLRGSSEDRVHLQSGTGRVEVDVLVIRAARVLGLVPG